MGQGGGRVRPGQVQALRKRRSPPGGAARHPMGFTSALLGRSLELCAPEAKDRQNGSQEGEDTHRITLLPENHARSRNAAHADDRPRPRRPRAHTLNIGPNTRWGNSYRLPLPARHLHSSAAASCSRHNRLLPRNGWGWGPHRRRTRCSTGYRPTRQGPFSTRGGAGGYPNHPDASPIPQRGIAVL